MSSATPAAFGKSSQTAFSRLSRKELALLLQAGMTYCTTRQFQEARDVFFRIGALDPLNPNAQIGLGIVCFSEGRFADAVAHYRQALQLDALSAYAYALLGESQIFLGESAAARVSLRRACEIDRKGPYGNLAQNLLEFLEALSNSACCSQDWQQ